MRKGTFHHTPEARAKISAAQKGRPESPETRAKMSAARKRRPEPNLIDRTGQRYGRLVVIQRSGSDSANRNATWLCRCDCGRASIASSGSLRTGRTKSCGCLKREAAAEAMRVHRWALKHGMSGTPEFHAWQGMIGRCDNPNNKDWMNYGGRGIKVSDEFHDFATWYAHIGPRPGPGYSQHRIDNDLGYMRGNLKWAVPSEQMSNRRSGWDARRANRARGLPTAAQLIAAIVRRAA